MGRGDAEAQSPPSLPKSECSPALGVNAMAEKDGWGAATMPPFKDKVSPQANKSFGPGMAGQEVTSVGMRAKEKLRSKLKNI